MDELLIVEFVRAQEAGLDIRGDYFTGNQTIRPKTVDSLEVAALEIQIGFFDEHALNLLRRKHRETVEDLFVSLLPGRGCEPGVQDL